MLLPQLQRGLPCVHPSLSRSGGAERPGHGNPQSLQHECCAQGSSRGRYHRARGCVAICFEARDKKNKRGAPEDDEDKGGVPREDFFEPLFVSGGAPFFLFIVFLPRDLGAGFTWANILLGEKLLKSFFDAQGLVVSLGEFADSRVVGAEPLLHQNVCVGQTVRLGRRDPTQHPVQVRRLSK